MPQNPEPLYVGVDVDALLVQLDQEDHHRAMSRRASARRRGPSPSPRRTDLDARLALGGDRPPALQCAHVA